MTSNRLRRRCRVSGRRGLSVRNELGPDRLRAARRARDRTARLCAERKRPEEDQAEGRRPRRRSRRSWASPSTTSTIEGEAWYYITSKTEAYLFYPPEEIERTGHRVLFREDGYEFRTFLLRHAGWRNRRPANPHHPDTRQGTHHSWTAVQQSRSLQQGQEQQHPQARRAALVNKGRQSGTENRSA